MIYSYTQSRAALSLLGYCYYQMQDFVNAADAYEQLVYLNPEVEDYKLYYAQALYKAGLYDESMKQSCQIDNPTYQTKVWNSFNVLPTVFRLIIIPRENEGI